MCSLFFFCLYPAPTESYTLSLHDALPICEAVIYPAANQFVARWIPQGERGFVNGLIFAGVGAGSGLTPPLLTWQRSIRDRKSTRLNSSHQIISYAVFCLKKKTRDVQCQVR